jgi:antitoxin HigA-1
MRNGMRPIHPGEILREDFLEPLQMSAAALARALHVPTNRITSVLNEQRTLTADTALRLSRYFGTTAEFWMKLQASFDLRSAEQKYARAITREIVPYRRRTGR